MPDDVAEARAGPNMGLNCCVVSTRTCSYEERGAVAGSQSPLIVVVAEPTSKEQEQRGLNTLSLIAARSTPVSCRHGEQQRVGHAPRRQSVHLRARARPRASRRGGSGRQAGQDGGEDGGQGAAKGCRRGRRQARGAEDAA
eukprot:7221335-Prymnesium_polylepis.1